MWGLAAVLLLFALPTWGVVVDCPDGSRALPGGVCEGVHSATGTPQRLSTRPLTHPVIPKKAEALDPSEERELSAFGVSLFLGLLISLGLLYFMSRSAQSRKRQGSTAEEQASRCEGDSRRRV
jgi:hypothetical protein